MSDFALEMLKKIENQLAQVILYLGALDALAAAYREQESLRQDVFLFGTVYDGLWDAVVVRIVTIWDGTGGVSSLPQLANHLQGFHRPEVRALVKEIRKEATAERSRLQEWRKAIVAHARFPLDAATFDSEYEISVEDVRKEAERIEQLLTEANRCLGHPHMLYAFLKEEALANARNSLARWQPQRAKRPTRRFVCTRLDRSRLP